MAIFNIRFQHFEFPLLVTETVQIFFFKSVISAQSETVVDGFKLFHILTSCFMIDCGSQTNTHSLVESCLYCYSKSSLKDKDGDILVIVNNVCSSLIYRTSSACFWH